MTYLLTLGWPWFSGALALGGLVGFVTFSREKYAKFSGGWIIVLGALTLATGFGASFADVLAGRDAMTLDVALLAGVAYAAGLPFGGVLKSLGGGEAAKKRATLASVVVTPPLKIAADEPRVVSEAIASALREGEPATEISEINVPESQAPEAAAPSEPRPANRAVKPAPGAKPETLAAPRNGARDDLARIKGIGPKSHEKLNALGVFHYDQIAAWNLDNARWIGAAIGAPGRVERDKWILQARALTGAGTDQ